MALDYSWSIDARHRFCLVEEPLRSFCPELAEGERPPQAESKATFRQLPDIIGLLGSVDA